MITFKTYFLIESMLEDIQVQDDLEDNILMLHEIEYKLSKLKDNPYAVNSKLYQNLFKRFYGVAYDIFEEVAPEIYNGFEQWKHWHQIDDAETWANMVFDSFEDSYGTTEGMIEAIMSDGISWGQLHLSPEQIKNHVDPEEAKSFVEEDIYNDPKVYQQQILEWLQTEKDFEGDEAEALEYYQDNDLYDEFIEYFLEHYFNPSDYAEIFALTQKTIINAIAEGLYTDYMNMFGGRLESIMVDIDEANIRIEEAENLDPNIGDSIIGQPEEKLGQFAETIYKAVSQMATAISLALNVNHVNGNILQDYANISSEFMDELNEYDTSEWDGEVNALMNRF